MLQREGYTRYALTAGEYRSGNVQQEEPKFFQGTVLHGLPTGWTIYGGAQLAERYRAVNLGMGKIWVILVPFHWTLLRRTPRCLTTAIIRDSQFAFCITRR